MRSLKTYGYEVHRITTTSRRALRKKKQKKTYIQHYRRVVYIIQENIYIYIIYRAHLMKSLIS